MSVMHRFLFVLAVCLLPCISLAVQPDEMLADPALEERARELSRELRCVVCQGESIDDSNAEIARDLRILVRERIEAGDSDEETMEFVVARYGEYVLFRPPFTWSNAALWLAGPVLLLLGAWLAFGFVRRQAGVKEPAGGLLSQEEERRLEELTRD